ncbi:MAG TPA: transposase, partial [Methylococcales bacterium]
VVSAIQLTHASTEALQSWLAPFQALNYKVLATLSDGEASMIEALQGCWPDAPHQRCQLHFLANLSEDALPFDTQLRTSLKEELKGLPKVPEHSATLETAQETSSPRPPLF